MRNIYTSLILVFVLLLILICILKQKRNNVDNINRNYLQQSDLHEKIADIFVDAWYSGILLKEKEKINEMIDHKIQINTYRGIGSNLIDSIQIINNIDILPNYKIKNLTTTLSAHNMIITHDLYQEENRNIFHGMFTLTKGINLKWKIISWSFYPSH